jgi:hypothetical protein
VSGTAVEPFERTGHDRCAEERRREGREHQQHPDEERGRGRQVAGVVLQHCGEQYDGQCGGAAGGAAECGGRCGGLSEDRDEEHDSEGRSGSRAQAAR